MAKDLKACVGKFLSCVDESPKKKRKGHSSSKYHVFLRKCMGRLKEEPEFKGQGAVGGRNRLKVCAAAWKKHKAEAILLATEAERQKTPPKKRRTRRKPKSTGEEV